MIKTSVASFVFCLIFPLIGNSAPSATSVLLEITGRIYPKDAVPAECANLLKGEVCKKDSYGKYHLISEKQGDLVYSKAIFSDANGPAVIEQSWEKNGLIQRGMLENKQLGVVGEIEVVGGKAKYKRTKDGKTKSDEVAADPNLVMPSTLMAYLRPRFDDILNGKTVQIKMAVLDRMDSFTFNIKKNSEATSPAGDKIIGLKMIPNSFIIQAAVDPIYFYINAANSELVAFEGRSALRRKVGEKYKDLDARTTYDPYLHNAFKRNLLANCNSAPSALGIDAKCSLEGEGSVNSSSKK